MSNQQRDIELFNSLFGVIERLGKAVENVETARNNICSENGIIDLLNAQTEFEDAREVLKIYQNNNPFTEPPPK